MNTIRERIDIIIKDSLCPQVPVTPETEFQDDLGADSLDMVELVMHVEEEFDISIPDDEIEKIQTVKDAYEYVEKACAGKE